MANQDVDQKRIGTIEQDNQRKRGAAETSTKLDRKGPLASGNKNPVSSPGRINGKAS